MVAPALVIAAVAACASVRSCQIKEEGLKIKKEEVKQKAAERQK
jgi:hypothetical protein